MDDTLDASIYRREDSMIIRGQEQVAATLKKNAEKYEEEKKTVFRDKRRRESLQKRFADIIMFSQNVDFSCSYFFEFFSNVGVIESSRIISAVKTKHRKFGQLRFGKL
jgi:hypothetical protein